MSTTSPRVPPPATATRLSVATSTIVSSLAALAAPVLVTLPALCVTNSRSCNTEPSRPKASESRSESKVIMTSARRNSVKRTNWRRSGQVTAQSLPWLSKARLPTRRFSSLLYCVNRPVAGSKICTPSLVETNSRSVPGSTASAIVMPSPKRFTTAPVTGSSCNRAPPPVVAQSRPSLSKARLNTGSSRLAQT